MAINLALFIVGVIFLYFGSEWLVKGASSLALSFSIRPVIIGLTIVAFATSAPELLVSVVAAAKGSSGVSIGNIIGSNVINIALVLGAAAIVRPLEINQDITKKELPYMVLTTVVFWIMCLDGTIERIDGIILLSMLAAFLVYGILTSKDNERNNKHPRHKSLKTILRYTMLMVIGLSVLAFGADLVVKSAIYIARQFGFSEVFIGLSVVALGTSLPELATSVVAVAKKESDISLGNVVGSNLFNICLVMGTVGLLNPMRVDQRLNWFEFPAMLFFSLLLMILTLSSKQLNRITGVIFISGFFLYIGISYVLAMA